MHESNASDLVDQAVIAGSWNFELDFTLKLCDVVGSLLSSHAKDLLKDGDFAGYLSLRVDPDRYDNPKHFAEDYLVASVLRKSVTMPLGVDTRAEALRKFKLAEGRNSETNDRLWDNPLPEWWGDYSSELLTILGPLEKGDLDEITLLCKHGNGGTVGVKGEGLVASDKYDSTPTVTQQGLKFFTALLPACVGELYTSCKMKVVQGSHWFSVLKDATTDRSCAKEPTWSMWFQLGIGRKIAKRLRRFGVDIRDQTRNQILASTAQRSLRATVDLSQASDLNARNGVLLALTHNKDSQGQRWYHLLDMARSHKIRLPVGEDAYEWKPLEMFSSMGNGFTFPLETALFLAMARSVVPHDEHCEIAVYGDDIIVPAHCAEELMTRLEFVGFKVNRSKTFLAGRFFESCGTDWFDGQNVRPFYLRNDPEQAHVPQELIAANRLRAWVEQVYGYCDCRYEDLWSWVVGEVPRPWNNRVPSTLGDVGVHSSQDEIPAFTRPKEALAELGSYRGNAWEGVVVKHVKMAPETVEKRSPGVLMSALARLETPRKDGVWSARCVRSASRRPVVYETVWEGRWSDDPSSMTALNGCEPVRGYLRLVSTTKTVVPAWGNQTAWL